MRILYISQYFPPEIGATQTRAVEMVTNLAKLGHEVVVLTEFPNHPKGIIPPQYKGKLVEHTVWQGIHIYRTWVYARPHKNFFTRMGLYLSFMLSAGIFGSFIKGPFDIIYTTSPPFFVGVAGLWLSRLKNAKFVFEVRDLWPESAVELGELSNPWMIKWAEKLENYYYRQAAALITVTGGIKSRLVRRGYAGVHLVQNGANTDLFCNRGPALKTTLGWQDKFVVIYAGIFGIAQSMEQLVTLVEKFTTNPEIQFVFIGEGPVKAMVQKLQQDKALTNLTLMNEVTREAIPDYISAADCCLVPLKKTYLFLGALPSKMFDYLACEKPVILSVDGEARQVLEIAGAGIYVEPENTEQMAQAILHLKANPALCKKMGQAGRAMVEKQYSRKQKALELEQILTSLLQNKRSAQD